MARLSKEARLLAAFERCMRNFDAAYSAVRAVRELCMEDRRFYTVPGASWEGSLEKQFENKPKFEFNHIHQSILRTVAEYRNNRTTVVFRPRRLDAAQSALADSCDALYRADEQRSVADEAYDNAFEEALGGGFGAWRVRAGLEDSDDPDEERQRVGFEPIFDADARVFFDPNAVRADKSDAKWCVLLTPMSRGAYKEEYGNDPSSWDLPRIARLSPSFDWGRAEQVFIAEYFEVEDEKETVRVYQLIGGSEKRVSEDDAEDDPELVPRLEAAGARLKDMVKVRCRCVKKYTFSGGGPIGETNGEEIPGGNIPIVPLYGKRWVVDGVEHCMGHVRIAKDAARLTNMLSSKMAEIAAKSSSRKPIFTPEQMVGHRAMWEDDDVKAYRYLLVNAVRDPISGQMMPPQPMAYLEPPNIPEALAALIGMVKGDIRELLGSPEAAEKLIANVSEETIAQVQQQVDLKSFIYHSNFRKAIKRSSRIWLGMAKGLYVENGRRLTGVTRDNESTDIDLLAKAADKASGAVYNANDFAAADMELEIDFGPSSSSRRSSTARGLANVLPMIQDPELSQVLGTMMLMNLDGEGMGDLYPYLRRKLLALGAVEPTDKERDDLAKKAQATPPAAQEEYLRAAAQKQLAAAQKDRADTVLSIARAGEAKARTADIAEGIDRSNHGALFDQLSALGGEQLQAAQPAPGPTAAAPQVL